MSEAKAPEKSWKRDVWPWIKARFESANLVLGLIVVIATLFSALIGFYLHIKNSAQSAVLDDPKFLTRLAEQVRPVCLLNSKGYFYEDYGALAFLDPSIKFEYASNAETLSFALRSKQFLRQAPLVSSLDGSLYLIGVEREATAAWRYTFGAVVTKVTADLGLHQAINTNATHLFRVEVLH
jgi:hypothetical protein